MLRGPARVVLAALALALAGLGAAMLVGSSYAAPTPCSGTPVTGGADVGATSATLHGSIDDSCLFYFDYATDAYFIANSGNYDQQTPESTGPPFSQTVAALLPNTTYHYRFVADNCNDRCFVAGADATFTTGTTTPEPPPRPPIDPHADLGVEVTASQATVLASSRRLTAAGSALTYTILV